MHIRDDILIPPCSHCNDRKRSSSSGLQSTASPNETQNIHSDLTICRNIPVISRELEIEKHQIELKPVQL